MAVVPVSVGISRLLAARFKKRENSGLWLVEMILKERQCHSLF
jgi:hypothetical protein